jgi:arylformamidase
MRGFGRWRMMAAAGLLAWLAGQAAATARTPVEQNIPYGTDPAQVLDLYHPAGSSPAPLVIFLHGGGWVGGNKGNGRFVAPPFVAAGYAVASIGYRLSPQVDPAGEVQDAAAGIAYLLHYASRFGINPARFVLIGHSSGAHMVALLGTDAGYLRRAGIDPAKLAAVVTLDGVFDVQANLTDFPNERREAVFGNNPADWARVSPVRLLAGMTTHPRFCLVHEDRNPRFIEQEHLFETALKQHGETVESLTAPGLTHGQLVQEFASPQEPMEAFALACAGAGLGR